jgi:hypothetical protein
MDKVVLKEKNVESESSMQSVMAADSLNNGAIVKLQLGNYCEARAKLVSGIGLLKEQHGFPYLTDNPQWTKSSSTKVTTLNNHTDKSLSNRISTISTPIASIRLLHDNEIVNENKAGKISDTDSSLFWIHSDVKNKQKQRRTELLKHSDYYNGAFYLTFLQNNSSVKELLVVMLFNTGLTYQKEAIDGRSSLYHKAMYLYKHVLSLTRSVVKSDDIVDAKQQQPSPLLLVVLATYHNIGFILKEIGQPKLYRSYIDAGRSLERKIMLISPHECEFFTMNRFFSRYYEHSNAEAA